MAHLTDDEKAARLRALNDARAADESALSTPVAQPDVDNSIDVERAITETVLRLAAMQSGDTDAIIFTLRRFADRVRRTPPSPPAADAELVKYMRLLFTIREALDCEQEAALSACDSLEQFVRTRLLAPERGTDAGEQTVRKPVDAGGLGGEISVPLVVLRTLCDGGEGQTEYDGRMYSTCAGCNVSEEGGHEPGCALVKARALLPTEPAPLPAPPSLNEFDHNPTECCGRRFKNLHALGQHRRDKHTGRQEAPSEGRAP